MAKPNLFFSTPVWTAKFEEYEEVNNEIYKYIKKLQQNDTSGIIKSNIKVGIQKILISKRMSYKISLNDFTKNIRGNC